MNIPFSEATAILEDHQYSVPLQVEGAEGSPVLLNVIRAYNSTFLDPHATSDV